MKKILLGIGSLFLIGMLSGCGNSFKCDEKSYAEQALNILLFENANGGDDKHITLKSLGFEVGDIALVKFDKDKNESICKAQISNSHIEVATDKLRQLLKNGKDFTEGLDKEAKERIKAFGALANFDIGAPIVMEELYQSIKGNRTQQEVLGSPGDMLTLYGIAKIATQLSENGLAYRTYDNGNGDLMIEAQIAK